MRAFRIFTLALLLPAPLCAWTPAADLRIASKGAALAPPDLRLMIDKFADDYQFGLHLGTTEEVSDLHATFAIGKRGELRGRLQLEIDEAIKMVRGRQSMRLFVQKLGLISHLVADANNPFHVGGEDRRLMDNHHDFERYFERRLAVFPTVFYGLEGELRLSTYLDGMFVRTSRFYPLLSEEYFRDGSARSSRDFDDRSTAFGIASLSYSHSVTDLVNLYYYIWREAGGDVRSAAVMRKGNLLLNLDAR